MLRRAPAFEVYRKAAGRLVRFDDYLRFILAGEVGREWVIVHMLGEARPGEREP